MPRYVAVCLASFVAAIVCPEVSESLLAGVLAVQSILLGFTVNVMFFLLGNREKETLDGTSIEAKVRSKRLRDLYHELFYNVSYFNLIAVASIIVATGLLLPTPEVPGFLRGLSPVEAYVQWLGTSKVPAVANGIARGGAMFVFYAISIEVVFSIARVIGRTSFYFERKMGEVRRSNDQSEG
ncbi:hypothetical protein [Sphingopyxis sp.]|uniref:hypothetical protein n=1 Tax=Sphingopyxis sp. TaxID=1908224 RepID=UPI003D6CA217